MKVWKKIFHANGNKKKAILISDKVDFKTKSIIKDKGHCIMINGSTQEKDITFINLYVPNIGTHKYQKQILTGINGETDGNTIIVGNFNSPLISTERSSRQKINKETVALNDTLEQMDLIDIYTTFHPKTAEYTFSSSTHEIFSWIGHMLGHKTSLNKF